MVFPRKVASLSPAFRLSPKGYFHVLPVLPPMYWFTDLDSDPRHFALKFHVQYPDLANSMLGFYIDIRYPVCCIDGNSLRTSIILDSIPPPPSGPYRVNVADTNPDIARSGYGPLSMKCKA